jgi:acid stress-induced BolA-like protein IbaG/YrbA
MHMEISELLAMVQAVLPDSLVSVDGEGCSFTLTVISPAFEGLTLLRRHQTVLAAVQEPLAQGTVHAVSVKTYTPEEWSRRSVTTLGAQPPG